MRYAASAGMVGNWTTSILVDFELDLWAETTEVKTREKRKTKTREIRVLISWNSVHLQFDQMKHSSCTFAAVIANMETLKTLGVAGFLFFLIKGLLWLVVFALVARGVLSKEQVAEWKRRIKGPFRRS